MRRILRKVAEGETQALGDTTTLLDPQVVDEIVAGRLAPLSLMSLGSQRGRLAPRLPEQRGPGSTSLGTGSAVLAAHG